MLPWTMGLCLPLGVCKNIEWAAIPPPDLLTPGSNSGLHTQAMTGPALFLSLFQTSLCFIFVSAFDLLGYAHLGSFLSA